MKRNMLKVKILDRLTENTGSPDVDPMGIFINTDFGEMKIVTSITMLQECASASAGDIGQAITDVPVEDMVMPREYCPHLFM